MDLVPFRAAFAGQFLDTFLTARMALFPPNTLIVISWDEDDKSENNDILVSLLDPSGSEGMFAAGTWRVLPCHRHDDVVTTRQVLRAWWRELSS